MMNNLLLRKDMCHWSRGMQIRSVIKIELCFYSEIPNWIVMQKVHHQIQISPKKMTKQEWPNPCILTEHLHLNLIVRKTFYLVSEAWSKREITYFFPFLRFNLSQLEDWVRLNQLEGSGIVEALENITQATQLLQVNKKTLEDVDAICEVCSSLNTLQVR